MTTEFTQLNLQPQLVQAVTELGYLVPMPIQSELIPVMLAGHDVIGQAQTGTGKTAAFALPILQALEPSHRQIQGLVLTPTRELALQVAQAIAQYGRYLAVRVLAVYGGQAYNLQIGQLKKGVEIVVGTPGRLLDLIHKGRLDLSQVRTVVLDEADEMLSMGFIEDIEAILAQTPTTRQTALFSATLPAEIRQLAKRYMRDPRAITIRHEQVTVETTQQRYYLVNRSDKLAALTRLFEIEPITRALVFVRTRADSGDLANQLTMRGFPAEALNGDLNQDARERTLNRFRQNQLKVLVATDVAARGLDIDDISHVFNYDLADDPEIYVHRIGRTGRAGKAGIAITLLSSAEKRRLGQIEAFTHQKLERATLPTDNDILAHREDRLVKQVTTWLQRGRCHRERELVGELVQDGYDPLEIAAVALKLARAEEKQRPINPLNPVADSPRAKLGTQRQRRNRDRAQPWAGRSHEPGMVRLSLNTGRVHGVRPNDIVGAIAVHANIPGHAIGKILIQDKHSLVDVPDEFALRVLAKTGEVYIRRKSIEVQRAE